MTIKHYYATADNTIVGNRVIVGDLEINNSFIENTNTNDDLFPFLVTIPLQKLAYYSALKKGYDIDKPRNLAKSVTVE